MRLVVIRRMEHLRREVDSKRKQAARQAVEEQMGNGSAAGEGCWEVLEGGRRERRKGGIPCQWLP